MSCNLGNEQRVIECLGVSIPIGFSNELQHIQRAKAAIRQVFQSLSGFPMSCNGIMADPRRVYVCVSIPIGFSNELQQ